MTEAKPLTPEEEEPEIICPLTGTYCTGDFCDQYGCAKKAGIWDEEDL